MCTRDRPVYSRRCGYVTEHDLPMVMRSWLFTLGAASALVTQRQYTVRHRERPVTCQVTCLSTSADDLE